MASLTDDNAADGNLDKRNIWLIGAGHTSISRYERGVRQLSVDKAKKIADILKVDWLCLGMEICIMWEE